MSTKQTDAAAAAESEEAPQVTLGGQGDGGGGQGRQLGGDLGNPLVIPCRRDLAPLVFAPIELSPMICCSRRKILDILILAQPPFYSTNRAIFREKFGMHYINFSDPNRERIPKESSRFFSKIVADNGFVEDK